ncbi:hypothetical protein AHF37_06034 [Paragonimus kellicotti]|nr:hypothetical protein AHF37_06034 [Paragonimus kellicotti]
MSSQGVSGAFGSNLRAKVTDAFCSNLNLRLKSAMGTDTNMTSSRSSNKGNGLHEDQQLDADLTKGLENKYASSRMAFQIFSLVYLVSASFRKYVSRV